MGLTADFSGAVKKMADLKATPRATKYIATKWGAETVKDLKRSASEMKKSVAWGRQKTSQLMRATSMTTQDASGGFILAVGTGLNTVDVKYARIQDEGGEIRPKGHPFLTIPMPGVTGKARDYKDSFVAFSEKGQWMIARSTGANKDKLEVLFLLRRKVRLPATRWFTKILAWREPMLYRDMKPDHVLAVAKIMSGER
jgi:hypothetical protein